MMKKYIFSVLLIMTAVFLVMAPFGTFLIYGIWSTNQPSNWGKPFPEGTQIIRQTDTHKGILRRKGIRVEVVRIPEQHIQEFGDRLRSKGFIPALPGERFGRLLSTIETAEIDFHSWTVLSNFGDGAVAFIEEPCSDWEEAVFDLETGMFYCIEYDE